MVDSDRFPLEGTPPDDYAWKYTWDVSQGRGLFSVALHQIGLALSVNHEGNATRPVTLTSPSPFDGEIIEVQFSGSGGAKILEEGHLLSGTVNHGERALLTSADILLVAEVNGWTELELPVYYKMHMEYFEWGLGYHEGFLSEYEKYPLGEYINMYYINVNEPSVYVFFLFEIALLLFRRTYLYSNNGRY